MTDDGLINRSSGVDAVREQLSEEIVERPGQAIGMFLLAMFVFTTMDGFSKYVTNSGLAPEVVTMLRYTIATSILLPVVLLRWEKRPLSTSQSILGASLIVFSGLYIWARERKLASKVNQG
jgi:hypothetical protein